MIVETRIPQYKFAGMDTDQEQELKDVCKRFARDMRFSFDWDYYSIYWEEENWALANLAMPNIDTLLTKVP
jgi:hypothetical protein|tara:strand:- start:242 stop:454 length:213 start_codon:yes stop_codon:yes gene_type:complete